MTRLFVSFLLCEVTFSRAQSETIRVEGQIFDGMFLVLDGGIRPFDGYPIPYSGIFGIEPQRATFQFTTPIGTPSPTQVLVDQLFDGISRNDAELLEVSAWGDPGPRPMQSLTFSFNLALDKTSGQGS
jgi:hypothetical protein